MTNGTINRVFLSGGFYTASVYKRAIRSKNETLFVFELVFGGTLPKRDPFFFVLVQKSFYGNHRWQYKTGR